MVEQPTAPALSILRRDAPSLRIGQTVKLRVIRHLIGRKWLIAISGRLYPALSGLDLEGDQRLLARVESDGNRILLRLHVPPEGQSAQRSGWAVDQALVDRALTQLGIQPDYAARLAAAALLQSGHKLSSTRLNTLRSMLLLLGNTGSNPSAEVARLLVEFSAKGLRLPQDQLQSLATLSPPNYDESGSGTHGDRRQGSGYRQRHKAGATPISAHASTHTSAHSSADSAADGAIEIEIGGDQSDHVLQLFNHLRGGDTHWVVVPLRSTIGGTPLRGVMRLCFDSESPRLLRAILDVGNHSGRWCGLLTMDGQRIRRARLAVAPDEPLERTRRSIARLRGSLQRLGIEMAAPVAIADYFDGFSGAGNLPSAVDTEV